MSGTLEKDPFLGETMSSEEQVKKIERRADHLEERMGKLEKWVGSLMLELESCGKGWIGSRLRLKEKANCEDC